MTIPYTRITPQPDNLEAGEIALEHDGDGLKVAVSVTAMRTVNNVGMAFACTARWIDDDGNTHECPAGPVITTHTHTADHYSLDTLTEPVITRELTYAMLGCALTERDVDGDSIALIPMSAEVLSNTNILLAIARAQASGAQDVGDALGL